jgi:predicted dehydrogenase
MKKIGIAMAGFGGIGRIHLMGYRDIAQIYPGVLPEIRIKGLCRSSLKGAEETVREMGLERAYAGFDEILEDPEIDVVDLVGPNMIHKDQILKALAAGKHILCEKPLAVNGEEAAELEEALKDSSLIHGMIFNYRFVPAIMKARELIEEGRLGEVYSFRGEYFHTGYQNPERPFSWRMDFERSGGGALVDLGVHVIDILRYLLGEYSSVRADMKTYVRERPLPGGGGMERVSVDDAAWLSCELASGSRGTIEVSRFATGTLDELNLTVFGSRGAFRFNLMDPGFLYWFDQAEKERGWSRLETMQFYPGARIPNPRSTLGWARFHTENQFRFLRSVAEGKPFSPSLLDGAAAQYVLDAAYLSARDQEEREVRKLAVSRGVDNN